MRAVIFDLDGTLWDATGQTFAVWNAVFARHPEISLRVTQAQKKALMGLTMSEIGERLFPGMDAAARNAMSSRAGASNGICRVMVLKPESRSLSLAVLAHRLSRRNREPTSPTRSRSFARIDSLSLTSASKVCSLETDFSSDPSQYTVSSQMPKA